VVSAPKEKSGSSGINGSQNQVLGQSNDNGAVYVFERTAGVWNQTTYVKATPSSEFMFFGISTALATDGNGLVVGARGAEMAFVFRRQGATWIQEASLTPCDSVSGHLFGSSVSLTSGNVLAVGSPVTNEGGRVRVYSAASSSFNNCGNPQFQSFSTTTITPPLTTTTTAGAPLTTSRTALVTTNGSTGTAPLLTTTAGAVVVTSVPSLTSAPILVATTAASSSTATILIAVFASLGGIGVIVLVIAAVVFLKRRRAALNAAAPGPAPVVATGPNPAYGAAVRQPPLSREEPAL
jgi:hypothetical protein